MDRDPPLHPLSRSRPCTVQGKKAGKEVGVSGVVGPTVGGKDGGVEGGMGAGEPGWAVVVEVG